MLDVRIEDGKFLLCDVDRGARTCAGVRAVGRWTVGELEPAQYEYVEALPKASPEDARKVIGGFGELMR